MMKPVGKPDAGKLARPVSCAGRGNGAHFNASPRSSSTLLKRNKNDARDAAAIYAALSRPDMRFVAIKSAGQQASRGLERSRDLLVKQHTQLINCMRSQLAELGIVAAQGRQGFAELAALLTCGDEWVPEVLVAALRMLLAQAEALDKAIAALEKKILAIAKRDPAMRRLPPSPASAD